MDRAAFQRLEALFHQAAALAPAEQAAFLDRECGNDEDMRQALDKMLRLDRQAAETQKFLAGPVARAASELRDDSPTLPPPQTAGAKPDGSGLPVVPGYELLQEVGRGGMGVVYKARQVGLNRLVALKMLLPFAAPTHEQLARFRTEAEALARLSHPNIIPIYEVGESAAGPYYSMEYVAGPSLADRIDGKPCDPASSARLVELLARAIDSVHRRDIVHRDLKPANILLSLRTELKRSEEAGDRPPLTSYEPKITDFGLAKDRTALRALTLSGTTLGTPCYMAPEQAGGPNAVVGPAADIYSLGAILYEMLAGRPPFEGVTAAETIARLVGDEPLSLSRLRPGLPRDLITICMKCLEKSPRRRYSSASALADDLRRFQAGEPVHAHPIGTPVLIYRWCRRRPLVATLATLCVGLLIAFVVTVLIYDFKLEAALRQARGVSEAERQQIVRLNVTIGIAEMENGDTFSAVLRFTEALRRDAGVPDRERSHRMRIAAALRECPRLNRLLVPRGEFLCARLTETGGTVATVGAENQVELWDVTTGETTRPDIHLSGRVTRADLSPDGRSLVTLTPSGAVRLWNLHNGGGQTLLDSEGKALGAPVFHPDGRLSVLPGGDPDIRQWATSGSANARMVRRMSVGQRYALSDDGNLVLSFSNGSGQAWDTRSGKTAGRRLEGVGDVVRCAISPDGRRCACAGADGSVRIAELETGQWLAGSLRQRVPAGVLAFSPNGEKLLTAGEGNVAFLWSVTSGELLATLVNAGAPVSFARFSRDGGLLVLGEGRRGARVWSAVSGRPRTPPFRHGGELRATAFLADGRSLVTAGRTGAVCLWQLPEAAPGKTVDAAPSRPTKSGAGAGIPSQANAGRVVCESRTKLDGRRLTVQTTGGGVCVFDTETRQPLCPPLSHASPVKFADLSTDGSLVVTADEEGVVRVWEITSGEPLVPARLIPWSIARVRFDSDADHVIVSGDGGQELDWDLTPDQRTVEELERLARVLACGWIDDHQIRREFDGDSLRAAYQLLP